MTDDGGVLGNLPNSRPGRRSAKRPASPRAAEQPAATERDKQDSASGQDASGDPVGEAIRTATGIAAAGARVANGVARELMRRLPRP
jgi:hypothetical protein